MQYGSAQAQEIYGFHGTNPNTVNSIVRSNFRYRFNGRHLYGKGNYFAKNIGYSLDTLFAPTDGKGLQYVFIARVCLGKIVKGRDGLVLTGEKHQSAVDKLSRPEIYVTFDDHQAFPEYLVVMK